ncbi:MAG: bifunctional glycosyltransferase/CDP-glycerol:glycerophosphate glycerophosphotransferase [Galactobacter sp.]
MLPVNVVSVIIPVYNREDWLSAAIDSVLEQDCGLEHLQVVLVNDGSSDGSPAICDNYARKYPNNVVVIHQENQGVAAAFNTGLAAASGDVIGFLGSDDYYSLDTLSEVRAFLNNHWDECDVAVIKIEMTGSRNGPHWNNRNRFTKNRVVDLSTAWNNAHLHSGGAFVKRQALVDHDVTFDPELFMTEDATLLTQVIMHRLTYGVVAKPVYFNRRYQEGAASQVASSHLRPEFYSVLLDHSYGRMFSDAKRLYGYIPKYVQAVCAYDLMFRFRANLSMLDDEQLADYRLRIKNLLAQIEVEVLVKQSGAIEQRVNMFNLRQDGKLREQLSYYQGVFSLENTRIYSLNPKKRVGHRPPVCNFHEFEIDGDFVSLAGTISAVNIVDNLRFIIRVGSNEYPIDSLPSFAAGQKYLSEEITWAPSFRAKVPFKPGDVLRVLSVVEMPNNEEERYRCDFRMGRATRFAGDAKLKYYRRDGDEVVRLVRPGSLKREVLTSPVRKTLVEAGFAKRAKSAGASAAVLARRAALNLRRPAREQIWLMMDHKSEAGDNAEALFRYLCAHPEHGIHPVLALSSKAPGYDELRALGEVVEPDSGKYFRRYFEATAFLNSAADEYVINPLGKDFRFLGDHTPPLSVFLQHGVTKDDLSGWLNWTRKGFDVFTTSATREYESIVDGNYAYTSDQVVLSGLPRFDRLVSNPEKLVVFAPTWRKYLSGEVDPATGRVGANPGFESSTYYEQWQSVINSERLNDEMLKHGYRGIFALHPSHAAEISKFSPGECISIAEYPYNYRELFEKGAILVTDYSSVAFDFAYLRKPVVYAQSDREEFFGGHLYEEGYFSYDDDGFGPVAFDSTSLVSSLVNMMVEGPHLEDKYRERIDEFFPFDDRGSSARLVEFVQQKLSRKGLA